MQTHRANGDYGITYGIMGFHLCFWQDIDIDIGKIQLSLLITAMDSCYITNSDSFFITSSTRFIVNCDDIIKCDDYYKL